MTDFELMGLALEEAAKAAARSAAEARVGVKGRMTELVVLLALLGVAKHLGGLVELLELLLALLVAGVQVGVVLLGELPVCLFDLVVRGALAHAQDLIVISFLFRHMLHLTICGLLRQARAGAVTSPGAAP